VRVLPVGGRGDTESFTVRLPVDHSGPNCAGHEFWKKSAISAARKIRWNAECFAKLV